MLAESRARCVLRAGPLVPPDGAAATGVGCGCCVMAAVGGAGTGDASASYQKIKGIAVSTILIARFREGNRTGAAPPLSSTDGSAGGGPSIAHRRVSYLDRMKDSILWSGGTCPALRWASQYKLARSLPQICTF